MPASSCSQESGRTRHDDEQHRETRRDASPTCQVGRRSTQTFQDVPRLSAHLVTYIVLFVFESLVFLDVSSNTKASQLGKQWLLVLGCSWQDTCTSTGGMRKTLLVLLGQTNREIQQNLRREMTMLGLIYVNVFVFIYVILCVCMILCNMFIPYTC